MLVHRRHFYQGIVALVLLVSCDGASGAEAVARKATVFGSPTANLRAGAGVEHALKQTLKEGDLLTVEESYGEWLLVSAADGQKGYIHKNLVRLEKDTPAPQVTPPSTKSDEVPGRIVAPAGNTQAVPMRASDGPKPPSAITAVDSGARASAVTAGKAPSVLQILESHEFEVKIALLAAGIAFVFGWFCGGHYYIRREHRHRRRLRL